MKSPRPAYSDCILRPVTSVLADAELLLRWRNADRVRFNMITDRIISRDEHMAWFQGILKETTCIVWIFEYQGVPLGQVNIKDIEALNNRCSWGFYLGEEGQVPGLGSAMLFLALEKIFYERKIRKLCSEILSFNEISINLHKKLGFSQEGCLKRHILRKESYVDLILMALFDVDWVMHKERLKQVIFAI